MTPNDRQPTDADRIAIAAQFYLDRCTWAPHDREREEYERLAARTAPPPAQAPMEREHAAWLDVGQEFASRGININEDGWTRLIYAIRKWGEELHQLRLAAPSHDEKALSDAREMYPEGQYERGTYPEAIDRG